MFFYFKSMPLNFIHYGKIELKNVTENFALFKGNLLADFKMIKAQRKNFLAIKHIIFSNEMHLY